MWKRYFPLASSLGFLLCLIFTGPALIPSSEGRAAEVSQAVASPADFTQQARLATEVPGDGYASAGLGYNAVAINGNTAIVNSAVGVYVYVRTGTTWSQQALLVPSDGIPINSSPAAAIDGDTVVLGYPFANINGNTLQGAAYVFVRNGVTWTEQQRLIASDGVAGDRYGRTVAINGDTIIVGVPENDVGTNVDQGSAYVYARTGTVWTEQTILLAVDGDARNYLGHAVAIEGDTAVVSRFRGFNATIINPAVYVFVRNGNAWQQQQRLSICEPSGDGGTQCGFGSGISVNADTLAVGNSFLNIGNNRSQGGVYVFVRSGTSWSLQQRVIDADGLPESYFGRAVSVAANTLIVGSPAFGAASSAYIFARTGSDWGQQQKLSGIGDYGSSVSMSGNSLLVASPTDALSSGNYIGAAYVYTRPAVLVNRSPFDFDGDSKTDVSVFRPTGAASEWWWLRSSDGGNGAATFGAATDMIVPGDYTGDGKADIAVWRPSNGNWFVLRSEDSSFFAFPFGTSGDVPVPADFDGDGKTDAAVFRPSDVTWYISRSSGGTTIAAFGAAGDKAVPADYDGDGKADIAIFRPNGANGAEWWLQRSTNSTVFAAQFGAATDKAVVGDYTGDIKSDIAIWRPADGNWFILRSEDLSFYAFPFGTNGDLPTPGDYDGDGKTDAAIFRPSSSTWFAQRSTAGTLIQQFGQTGDVPVPNAFVR